MKNLLLLVFFLSLSSVVVVRAATYNILDYVASEGSLSTADLSVMRQVNEMADLLIEVYGEGENDLTLAGRTYRQNYSYRCAGLSDNERSKN